MDEDEAYENEEGLEEDVGEEDEDEEMDDVNGDAASETSSAFPVLEPSLKSVMGLTTKSQGLSSNCFQFAFSSSSV